MSELLQLLANGLVTGSILSIGAVGLTLVYGILRSSTSPAAST
jgi:branched-subunit amino acid ABC-type transport system permease component